MIFKLLVFQGIAMPSRIFFLLFLNKKFKQFCCFAYSVYSSCGVFLFRKSFPLITAYFCCLFLFSSCFLISCLGLWSVGKRALISSELRPVLNVFILSYHENTCSCFTDYISEFHVWLPWKSTKRRKEITALIIMFGF